MVDDSEYRELYLSLARIASPIDPVRLEHLHRALGDAVEADRDPQQQEIATNDLIRRFGVKWEDLLLHPLNPDDPLHVRQATLLAARVWMCRQHAEPGWLGVVAFMYGWAVRGSPRALQDMMPIAACVAAREEARLEACGFPVVKTHHVSLLTPAGSP